MRKLVALAAILVATPAVHAAPNIEAGKAKVAQVCGACHGTNGVSVSDTTPNLAAQRAAYIENQLKAFKDGTRKAPSPAAPAAIMSAIAAQLSADDIANVAAWFSSQPGAEKGARSAQYANLAKTNVTF